MQKILVMMLSILVLTFSTVVNTEASTKDQATWLWNPWMLVNNEAGTIEFLKGKQVNKVYIQIDRDLPVEVYRSFVEKASQDGIRVYALDGAPSWVAPKGYIEQNKLINWLGNYQSGSTHLQKFSGVHLDVEPYLYSGWTSNQATTIKKYQELIVKAQNSTATLQLPLEVDLPFWFDEINYKNSYGKGVLAEWIISKVNGVTIMAYRDSATSIIEIVRNEIAYGEKYKKSVVVGVETGQTDEGDQISFFEEGEAFMNGQLQAIDRYYSGYSGYGGIAVHHVASWMEMRE